MVDFFLPHLNGNRVEERKAAEEQGRERERERGFWIFGGIQFQRRKKQTSKPSLRKNRVSRCRIRSKSLCFYKKALFFIFLFFVSLQPSISFLYSAVFFSGWVLAMTQKPFIFIMLRLLLVMNLIMMKAVLILLYTAPIQRILCFSRSLGTMIGASCACLALLSRNTPNQPLSTPKMRKSPSSWLLSWVSNIALQWWGNAEFISFTYINSIRSPFLQE